MEEYKKPEFTVKMDAPDKPLRLGQPIPVSVQADYYAGGPVNEGKATITITRTLGADVWTPYWKWSWLYSRESSPYYIYFTPDPPLTVLEKTIPLDKEGKASVELSTEQDARDFASQDITYRVSVSVKSIAEQLAALLLHLDAASASRHTMEKAVKTITSVKREAERQTAQLVT